MKKSATLLACAFGAFLVASSAFAAGGQGAEQASAPSSELYENMALYAAGITLGKVDLDTVLRAGKYHAVSNLETAGIVNAFWQSKIQATSSGDLNGNHFQPALYDSFYTGRENHKQEVSLTYDSGAIRLYANPPYSTGRYPVSPAQQKGTFDPLSAIVYVVSSAGAGKSPCDVTAPVFDGKRRYNVVIQKEKDTTVSMDNGLYKGPAVQCTAHYDQIAGFSQKILSENASFPVIHAWLAIMPSKLPGRSYAVPLRVWANTEYGTVAAVATALKVDGIDKSMAHK